MKLINKLLAVTAISVALVPGVVSADCGKARLADFDWSSANIHTAIAGFILEHGYGCDVSVTKGSTTPIMAAHYDGQLDVVTELWYDNIKDTYDSHEAAGTVRNLGINTPDSQQAFYVDRATADKYNLTNVLDMNSPEIAALFSDPENPSMGRMTSCIGGWTCYTINLRSTCMQCPAVDYSGSNAAMNQEQRRRHRSPSELHLSCVKVVVSRAR